MARNLWSDRPLGVKLAALVGAGAVSLGVFAVISVQALNGTGETAHELLASAEATEDVLLADMMHDAVRGDVLQAMVSGGEGELYRGAVADLAEHDQFLRDILTEVVGDDLNVEVDAAVEAVTPAVEAYLASAADIVGAAGIDPAAAYDAYPQFAADFGALEDELPKLGDAVAAYGAEAAAGSEEQRGTAVTLALIVAGVGVVVLGLLGWFITRSVVGPLRRVGAVVAGLADGDLLGRSGVDSKDEVGRMATGLETAMANMRSVMSAIGDSSETLASATEQLSASAQDMARLADESSTQSAIVADAAVQVSTNVQTVAAGSEQMGSSIREIAQNASDVSRVAAQAVGAADSTTATARVLAIQTDTEGAVTAISEISAIIGQINDSQSTIAAAVEEQTATTTEMNRNVSEAAQSANQIAENIEAVAAATGSTTRAMGDAQAAIDEVARMATTLQGSVARFRF